MLNVECSILNDAQCRHIQYVSKTPLKVTMCHRSAAPLPGPPPPWLSAGSSTQQVTARAVAHHQATYQHPQYPGNGSITAVKLCHGHSNHIANHFAVAPPGEYAEGRQTMTHRVVGRRAFCKLSDWCVAELICNTD